MTLTPSPWFTLLKIRWYISLSEDGIRLSCRLTSCSRISPALSLPHWRNCRMSSIEEIFKMMSPTVFQPRRRRQLYGLTFRFMADISVSRNASPKKNGYNVPLFEIVL